MLSFHNSSECDVPKTLPLGADNDDDTDWFFSIEESPKDELFQADAAPRPADLSTNESVLAGLQHSMPLDFAISAEASPSVVSLPMRLAVAAADIPDMRERVRKPHRGYIVHICTFTEHFPSILY